MVPGVLDKVFQLVLEDTVFGGHRQIEPVVVVEGSDYPFLLLESF